MILKDLINKLHSMNNFCFLMIFNNNTVSIILFGFQFQFIIIIIEIKWIYKTWQQCWKNLGRFFGLEVKQGFPKNMIFFKGILNCPTAECTKSFAMAEINH